MPKKPKLELRMTGYPPFSTRRWQLLEIAEVGSAGRGNIRFVLTLVDNPAQAGRRVNFDVPALLTPSSPLGELLSEALGVKVASGHTIDLAALVGRHILARFGEPGPDGVQTIVAVKPYTQPATKSTAPAAAPTTSVTAHLGKPGGGH